MSVAFNVICVGCKATATLDETKVRGVDVVFCDKCGMPMVLQSVAVIKRAKPMRQRSRKP